MSERPDPILAPGEKPEDTVLDLPDEWHMTADSSFIQEQRRIGWDARQAQVEELKHWLAEHTDGYVEMMRQRDAASEEVGQLKRECDELRNALMLATRGGDIEWGKQMLRERDLSQQNYEVCHRARKNIEAERDAALDEVKRLKEWREAKR